MPRDFEDLNMSFFELAITILIEEPENKNLCPPSVKLVAVRCINKYSRKIKKDLQVYSNERFEKILD